LKIRLGSAQWNEVSTLETGLESVGEWLDPARDHSMITMKKMMNIGMIQPECEDHG
jgi:hypothetical protein